MTAISRFEGILGVALAMTVLSCAGTTTDSKPALEPRPEVEEQEQNREGAAEPGTRNPFGLRDVEECCGPAEREYADSAPALGADDDANAESWSDAGGGPYSSIEGEWASRWTGEEGEWVRGEATIRTIGDRVYVHYRDQYEYLIEAERDGARLVGRYINMSSRMDTFPWTGTIVSPVRIDGVYPLGRWDFQRAGGGS